MIKHTLVLLVLISYSVLGEPRCDLSLFKLGTPTIKSKESYNDLREDLERRALAFFLDNTEPNTGWTLDRAKANGQKDPKNTTASIAATGFGMSVMAHAAKRGWMPEAEAKRFILNALNSALKTENHNGWLPHFIDWKTSKPMGNTEFSTIDTALFMAGALYAAQTFPEDKGIHEATQQLYKRLNFQDMLTNGGKILDKKTLSMGWDRNSKKYIQANWDTYSEHTVLQVLGLGSTEKNALLIPAWKVWAKQLGKFEDQKILGMDLPLFAHQYSWLWLDPRSVKIDSVDIFKNSRLATLRDMQLSKTNPLLAPYGISGLSASDSPDGYRAFRFGDGVKDKGDNNGTVCPGCLAASMVFAPEQVLPYVDELMNSPQKNCLVGKYGFVDAFNPSRNWAATDSLAITIGPVYMSSVNLRDGSMWKTFGEIPQIQKGIKKAGFFPSESIPHKTTPSH